jgi:hypothetical protein
MDAPQAIKPPHFETCIAVGCITLDQDTWEVISNKRPTSWSSSVWVPEASVGELPEELIAILRKSPILGSFMSLYDHGWINLQMSCAHGDIEAAVCRVFILPDDVDRRRVSRFNPKLRKDLQLLLGSLDRSEALWNCQSNSASTTTHSDKSNSPDEQETLLQMFNSIPSPQPHRDRIRDADYRAMFDSIMSSEIPGLTTKLYGYQSRSAALLLERETSPGTIIDPTLIATRDQNGKEWFYDDVPGRFTVLREPRLFDGVPGGVLAEEMGTGKTHICLALILATRHYPSEIPEIYQTRDQIIRPRIGSLMDMAAAVATRTSAPWRLWLAAEDGLDYRRCLDAIARNPGYYMKKPAMSRRISRHSIVEDPPVKVFLSQCSLILVPRNLLKQWQQEIEKHTTGLKVLVVSNKAAILPPLELTDFDVVLFPIEVFARLWDDREAKRDSSWTIDSPLAAVQFKRVIVDEGHKLGSSTAGRKSDMLLVLDCLNIHARWIVTGTPSTGLFGVDSSIPTTPTWELTQSPISTPETVVGTQPGLNAAGERNELERKDLERIKAMASLFLKVRPWAKDTLDTEDSAADWDVYVMQPKHSRRSCGRKSCLRATLDSLIVRHQRAEIGDLLPLVEQKTVLLDGCYQDKLTLNLFAMTIILNAVQSQRTDQDYFFHPRQRKPLAELVSNMRQSSFYGGYFYPVPSVLKSLETAEKFMQEGKVPISESDDELIRGAIQFGMSAVTNHLKAMADMYHEVPIMVKDIPGDGTTWALDGKGGSRTISAAPVVLGLQRHLRPCIDAPHSLQVRLNDPAFKEMGNDLRAAVIAKSEASVAKANETPSRKAPALAGNTQTGRSTIGNEHGSDLRGIPDRMEKMQEISQGTEVAATLLKAQLVATASAKLSYLLDAIIKYQEDEQIIIFYENDNVAFYLAEHLEIVSRLHGPDVQDSP